MTSNQKLPQTARESTRKSMRPYEHFEEVKSEFLKISWTEGDEVLSYAKAVVVSTFAFGLLIYVADLIINQVIFGFDTIFKWVIG